MKLVSVSGLAEFIGFDPNVETARLTAASEAATQTLTGLLRTEFDRVAVIDQFYILPTGSIPLGSIYRTRLALSRGFIDGDVTLGFSDSLEGLTAANLMTDTTATIDKEKGGIVLTGSDFRGMFISASYMAGFNVDGSDDTVYDDADVPAWLSEMAKMEAVATLDMMAPDVRFEKGVGAKDSAASLHRSVIARAEGKIRYFPSATYPIA